MRRKGPPDGPGQGAHDLQTAAILPGGRRALDARRTGVSETAGEGGAAMNGARKLGAYLSPVRPRAPEGGAARNRPEGELVWCQATTPTHVEVALQLADRLSQARPDLHLLLTAEEALLAGGRRAEGVIQQPLPADSNGAAEEFLDRWAPDLCVWTGGDLRPTLIGQAYRRGIPLFLVDADETRLWRPGWRFLPDATRSALRRFDRILARTASTEAFLRRRQGLREARITVTGELREESRPMPCNESDYEELSGLLRGRPIWLAAHLQPEEIELVLQANGAIARLSHRALVIVVPDRPEQSAPFRAALEASGLRFIAWSEGGLPDEATQAILADTPGELGLWYRVAPICFMGNSLCTGMTGSDPNEPAAHGSAILYGPNVRNYLAAYSRFAEAGGARIVRDAETLAAAVQQLVPADQSAAMAHAAWDVATQSAEVMDMIVATILDSLDAGAAV